MAQERRALWRAWYQTPAWAAIKAHRKAKEPYCRKCAAVGLKTPVDIIDHVEPHRGRRELFFRFENTQSLCKQCHDSTKQQSEVLGYSTEIGPDGLPIDPRHPFNCS